MPRIGKMSLHADIEAARSTISRIRVLERVHGVRTVLAHDESWIKEGKDAVLLSLLDEHMLAARDRILAGETP
ncbi:MAG: hypothetical protein EOO38_24925 [Cytophagaceae bacterium]|nr:MAG: hypothetical protein EOO38_24925 [Cytophagaceae bacterium]